jgi:hypothetical protein
MREIDFVGRLGLIVMGVVVGCARETRPFEDHSRDAQRYAATVKQMVFQAAQDAVRSPEPADVLLPLVQELEQTDRPRGEFRSIFEELHRRVQEAYQTCQAAGGRPPNFESHLRSLLEIAYQLPGDVGTQMGGLAD